MRRNIPRTACTHHWIIESSNDEFTAGRCKYCGDVREFVNNWDKALERVRERTDRNQPVTV